MITSRRAAIGGVQLDEVDDSIVIQGIRAMPGKETFSTVTPYGGPGGQRITGQHRDTLDLQISFGIRLKKDFPEDRDAVLDLANNWASQARDGAWITTSQKKDKRLWARVVQYPEAGDMREWTNNYTFVFRAYDVPWWQDLAPVTVNVPGISSGNQQITVPGNVLTVLDAVFTNTSGGTISNISLRTSEAVLAFTGLNLPSGRTFQISHDVKGRLIAACNGTACRVNISTASDNDLYILPGTQSVRFSANGSGTLELSAVGRYA